MKARHAAAIVLLIVSSLLPVVVASANLSPLAENYDFVYPDLDTTPHATTAANYQKALYDGTAYDAHAYFNASAAYAYSTLDDDALFYFTGHGIKSGNDRGGGIYFYHNNQDSYILAEGQKITDNDPRICDFGANALDGLLFALYQGCHTAHTSTNWGNLLAKTTSKGADAALGFDNTITAPHSNYWGDRFWYHATQENKTIVVAASNAKDDVWQRYGTYGGTNNWVIQGSSTIKLHPARYGS